MAIMAAEVRYALGMPDRMILLDPSLQARDAEWVATDAVHEARLLMPRVTGGSASRLMPISGQGYFGIYFPDATTWFQEHGTKPHTMRSLAGKTIPMWVNDPDGAERERNPKAETRTTEDGRQQTLIFRRAARQGERRTRNGRSVPASYPGAPGRISIRNPDPLIGAGNVGVRWRHPGLQATGHLNQAISMAAVTAGLNVDTIYVLDGGAMEGVLSGELRGLI